MLEFADEHRFDITLKVIGVGGAGGNAVDALVDSDVPGVDLIAANTDAQALGRCRAGQKIQLGEALTKGWGAGSDPEIGRAAAEESRETIAAALAGADLVFVACGLGGGTGTGASPLIARIAREQGALVVGAVTKPFLFEGRRRFLQADAGAKELTDCVDTLITIPNQKLFTLVRQGTPLVDAFRIANNILLQGIQGITTLVTMPGLINLDFADIRTIMTKGGDALLGVGSGSGEGRAPEAAAAAVSCPLLDGEGIGGARRVLLNITGGTDLTLDEVDAVSEVIYRVADHTANVIFGACVDSSIRDELRVTLIATGLSRTRPPEQLKLRAADHDPAHAPTREAARNTALVREILGDGFIEDELDVPTFLRKGRHEAGVK